MADGIRLQGVRVAQARQKLPGFNGRGYLRQSEFAEKVGIHPVTMNRIENDNANVSLEMAERLADALCVTREWLQGEDDPYELARVKMGQALEDFNAAVNLLKDAATKAAAKALEQVA